MVLELVFGIIIGPDVLGLAEPDSFIKFFSNLGLGMLFFFAGYEIDFARIKGEPLKLAAIGWLISLALAYSIGGLLALGRDRAFTPVHRVGDGDDGDRDADPDPRRCRSDQDPVRDLPARRRCGRRVRADHADHVPVLDQQPARERARPDGLHRARGVAAVVAIRWVGLGWSKFEVSMETSAQLPIRIAVVLIFALAYLASELGLDLLLGGFVAGVIVRLALKGREVKILESKLSAVGYGFLIPFFFVVSGIEFDMAPSSRAPTSSSSYRFSACSSW